MKTSLQRVLSSVFVLAIMALPTTSPAASIVINDSILENQDDTGAFVSRSVDFFKFSTGGGLLTFDVFASDRANGLDDSMIWLFNDDGHLDPVDWLAENDDTDFSTDANNDSSLNELDSFLSTTLSAGNYWLAIGSSGDVGGTDMIDGVQLETSPFSSGQSVASSFNLDYQLTINGDFNQTPVTVSPIPEPASIYLFVSGLTLIGLRFGKRLPIFHQPRRKLSER